MPSLLPLRILSFRRAELALPRNAKGDIVTQANAVRPYRMVSAGILAGSLALFSSRIDKWMFYTLASGSTLLAIAFSSHSLALFCWHR